MFVQTIKNYLTLNIEDEHKDEFYREITEANLIRGKIVAILMLALELLVIIFSAVNAPEEICTQPRCYYYLMYLLFIVVMTFVLILLIYYSKRIDGNIKTITWLTYSSAAFLIAWNMVITLLDMMNFGSVVTYTTVLIGVSVVLFIRPKALVSIFVTVHIAFMILLPFFYPEGHSFLGEYINTTITMIISCFLGFIIYKNRAVSFAQRKIIEQKNEQLRLLNEQLNEKNKKLDYLSKTDGLTGIFNRRMFDDMSVEFWEKCSKERLSLSVLMMDIDFFKEYNDNFGHQAGDDCLIKLVETISSASYDYANEEKSILARYGGEEFVLVVCGIDEKSSFELAESIRKSVGKAKIERKYKKAANHITLSIGVYHGIPTNENSIEGFIGNADKALYQAKNSGRNQTKVYR